MKWNKIWVYFTLRALLAVAAKRCVSPWWLQKVPMVPSGHLLFQTSWVVGLQSVTYLWKQQERREMRACSQDLCSDCREPHVHVCVGVHVLSWINHGGVLAAVRHWACQAEPCLGGQGDQQECVTPPSAGTQLWYYLTHTHANTHALLFSKHGTKSCEL